VLGSGRSPVSHHAQSATKAIPGLNFHQRLAIKSKLKNFLCQPLYNDDNKGKDKDDNREKNVCWGKGEDWGCTREGEGE